MIVNESFFDDLNEFSLYTLGYLYANGSVYRGKNNKRYELTISGTDPELLHQIRIVLRSDHPISRRGGSYQLRITNKALILRLELLGLTAGKTKNLKFPSFLPRRMLPIFIRGYFDGQGSFLVEKGRRLITNISGGSRALLEGIRNELTEQGLNHVEVSQYGEPDDPISVLRYYINDTRRFYALIYEDANIYSQANINKYKEGV